MLSLLGFLGGLAFVLATQRNEKITREFFWYVISLVSILSFIVAGSLLYEINFDAKRVLGLCILFITLIISPLFLQYVGSSTIKTIILIHVFFFYGQFLLYYVFGVYIDYLVIAESYSRNMGGYYEIPFYQARHLMRPSGLYAEPGNYANYMFLLYVLHCVKSREDDIKIDGILFYLFVSSLVLSFSTFGAIFFVAILMSRLTSLKAVKLILPPLILFIFIVLPFLVSRYQGDFSGTSSLGISFRYMYLSDAISNFNSLKGWIVGEGTLSVPTFFEAREGSDNDTGLSFFVLREMGVVVVTLFLLTFFYSMYRQRLPIFFVACLFTKLTPFMFFLPLVYSRVLFYKVPTKTSC